MSVVPNKFLWRVLSNAAYIFSGRAGGCIVVDLTNNISTYDLLSHANNSDSVRKELIRRLKWLTSKKKED